ncbi:uncharacterized protein LOC119325436 [Triticum dicoccoides]|uniref:uncharacterized protein LOC119325436 n=1 Tax=Triticum dicoccoides TaxID=85692 RepID=UPI0018917DE0|nr:uncharacterized protein LOC119325436 [Triticum dicoccoides]
MSPAGRRAATPPLASPPRPAGLLPSPLAATAGSPRGVISCIGRHPSLLVAAGSAPTTPERACRSSPENPFPQVKKYNGDDDRISTLPSDILVNILDRLNVREAARTSILSIRWSQLSCKLPRLIINAQPDGVSRSNSNISDADLVRINAASVEATKSLLTRRCPGEDTIRLLSTTFYLRGDVPISIGHAVGSAMTTHKIENAEFTVLTVKNRLQCTLDDVLNHGAQFVSFFNECLNAFTGLTRLYMENLRFVDSDFVSNIFVTCKRLKYLGFLNCDTQKRLTLQVEHAQLTELSMLNCRFYKVELKWLPRLTRTTFTCWMTFEELPLSFGHVPLLEFLNLTNIGLSRHKMVMLSTLLCETHIQELRLGFKCEKIWVQPECLSERLASALHRLRIVSLVCIPEGSDLKWTNFILEAAPSLEELYMSVIDHPCEMIIDPERRMELSLSENKGVEWESLRPHFKHRRLAKLVIFCFVNYMVSYVRRVMIAAVNLKDVYLYDRLACSKCKHMAVFKPGRLPRAKKKLEAMKKLLAQGIESAPRIHLQTHSEMDADHAARVKDYLCS